MYHKDLEVYKLSIDLVVDIYQLTNSFPQEEQFGLVSQMRRCAISIPSNIAEGCARFSNKETNRFISISTGSLAELDTQITIAKILGYIDNIDILQEKIRKVNALIIGLKKYYEKNNS